MLCTGTPHGRDYNRPFPLPKGLQGLLELFCCGMLYSQHKQTFTILPHALFRVRTSNDEGGNVHSMSVLLMPNHTIKHDKTQ